jgi:hypothetical protein|tara:strand:- start:1852 stop:3318 length:1467 start_codon:yes stop_codon:yes gene_type:complete
MQIFRRVESKLDTYTAAEFLREIENNPKYVMADLAFQTSKFTRWTTKEGISFITSMMRNMAPSKFIFCDVEACYNYAKKMNNLLDMIYFEGWMKDGVRFLNIDSNNRVINILKFARGEFGIEAGKWQAANGVYTVDTGKNDGYALMHANLREMFDNAKIDIEVYKNCNREEISDLFKLVNDGQPLNRPEKRNAVVTVVADIVRDLTNKFMGTFMHPDTKWFSNKDQIRRKIDEFVAHCMWDYYDTMNNIRGFSKSSNDNALDLMYADGSTANLDNGRSFEKTFRGFVTNIWKHKDLRALTEINGMFDLWHIYHTLIQQNYHFKDLGEGWQKTRHQFIHDFLYTWAKLMNDDTAHLHPVDADGKRIAAGKKPRWKVPKTFDLLRGGRQIGNNKLRNKLILENLDVNKYFVERDKRRDVSPTEKFVSAFSQDLKTPEGDQIDPSKLHDGSTYHGGHDTPWADGGRTNQKNTKVQTSEANHDLTRNPITTE